MKRGLNNHYKGKRQSSVRMKIPVVLQKLTKETSLDFSYGGSVNTPVTQLGDSEKRMEVNKVTKKTRQNRHKEVKAERYGRWTDEEHERLMDALDLYGNAWSLVEKYLGTRTRSQIRSHVQKYFLRVRKNLISEMAEKGELKRKVFVITREYRNNTRAIMEAYNKTKKTTPHLPKAIKKKPSQIETVTVVKTEVEPQLGPNEFLSPMNPGLEQMWKQARENEEKLLGHTYDLGFNLCPEPFESEQIEIMCLDKSEEKDRLNLEADNIECREEDSVLLI